MLNKWVEVGNSGMFRPEMLEPMGFPKDVHVHGWGISLERPTMIRCVQSDLIAAGLQPVTLGRFQQVRNQQHPDARRPQSTD